MGNAAPYENVAADILAGCRAYAAAEAPAEPQTNPGVDIPNKAKTAARTQYGALR